MGTHSKPITIRSVFRFAKGPPLDEIAEIHAKIVSEYMDYRWFEVTGH